MTRLGSLPAQRVRRPSLAPRLRRDSSCCQSLLWDWLYTGAAIPALGDGSTHRWSPFQGDPLLRTILQWPPDGNPRRDTLTPSAELQVYPPRTVARGSGGSRSAVAYSNEFITRGEGSSSLASQDTAWRARLCVPPEKAGAALVGSGSRAHKSDKTLQKSCDRK